MPLDFAAGAFVAGAALPPFAAGFDPFEAAAFPLPLPLLLPLPADLASDFAATFAAAGAGTPAALPFDFAAGDF